MCVREDVISLYVVVGGCECVGVSACVRMDVYISTVYSIPPLLTSTPADSSQSANVTSAGTPQMSNPRKKVHAQQHPASSTERMAVSPQKTGMLLLNQSV